MAGDPARAARSNAESRSKGSIRFCHASTVGRCGGRERAFERLRLLENRRREPWVLESLRYLNHPLRAGHAQRFVRPALDLLREIQQTGDIFFPTRWTESTLAGHRSPEVAAIVRGFPGREPTLPAALALDDSQLRRRTVQSGALSAVISKVADWRSARPRPWLRASPTSPTGARAGSILPARTRNRCRR